MSWVETFRKGGERGCVYQPHKSKRLEFLKTREIVLNNNVETIDLDVPAPKRQKLTDKLTEKMAVLGKCMEILNSKSEERTEADEDIFGKMVAVTLK